MSDEPGCIEETIRYPMFVTILIVGVVIVHPIAIALHMAYNALL